MPTALILVDIQNDFLPGGALAVPEGNQVIPIVNRLIERFEMVVATQDWHPPNHGSFASQHSGRRVGDLIELDGLDQILWPDHCVESTPGAEFAAALQLDETVPVFRKGTDREVDSYSGFFDNGQRRATGLCDYLRQNAADEVVVVGLATDYCVKYTALDAVRLGFRVTVVEDACRGVNLQDGGVAAAVREMRQAEIAVLPADRVDINQAD